MKTLRGSADGPQGPRPAARSPRIRAALRWGIPTLGAFGVAATAVLSISGAPATTPRPIMNPAEATDPVVRANVGDAAITATLGGVYSPNQVPSTATLGTWGPGGGGTCSKGNDSYPMNQTQTNTRTVVSYPDQYKTVSPTSVSEPLSASALPDGKYDRTVTAVGATASETASTQTQTQTNKRAVDGSGKVQCSGTPGAWENSGSPVLATTSSASVDLSESDTFVVDLDPPVVTARFSGNATAPTAPTGGQIDAVIAITDGTPGNKFTLTLTATKDGGQPITGTAEGTFGKNGTENFSSLGLDIPCSAALGEYELTGSLTGFTDVTGALFEPVTFTVGTFGVVSNVNLVATTGIYGFMDIDGDGVADFTNVDQTGFTSVAAAGKINTTPGAFHATALMKTTGQCNATTLMNFAPVDGGTPGPDVVLTAPAGFQFVMTGKTYAKVYAGKGAGGGLFNYEKPELVGVSSSGDVTSMLGASATFESVNSSTTPTVLSVNLDKLGYYKDDNPQDGVYAAPDTFVKGGKLPADWKVYVRVRARYTGLINPTADQAFAWTGMAHVDGYNGAGPGTQKTNVVILVANPTPLVP